uniref:Uncharacterized protein n=1 Tax=Arundo donax TaxID=35708 RepID=A0A0A8YUH0_ARUDO
MQSRLVIFSQDYFQRVF